MVLELYLDLLSQPCRAVYLFAKKNGIPFEFKDVTLFKDSILGSKAPGSSGAEAASAQTGPQEKLTLSKKVPFLKDGTFVLTEGIAILLYLTRKYCTPDHWYPADIEKRSKVDEYLFWHQGNMRADAPKTMWIKVLIPLFTGEPLPAGKLQEVMEGLASALKQMEDLFLGNRPFLAGHEISVADLVAVAELMQPVGVGCNVFEGHPRLAEWRVRVEMAVGRELFLQAHETVLKVREMSGLHIDPRLKAQLAPALKKIME
ncbi:glutathione S-transferase theta-1-like [Sceloporus undulatus]|uniref:glutathione S-transferase theta-1-like n=1 Tax=Sceloporus undulatus TaxID=8520 RepID=UPI001C4BD40D|nr:glutathione S-transferase theta-1-like [Sceloporus undulatus]